MYDVVLDWILMDAFDDLSNPPSSVISVVQNRWLSTGLKETAISTAVWSILKAKRRLLKVCCRYSKVCSESRRWKKNAPDLCAYLPVYTYT